MLFFMILCPLRRHSVLAFPIQKIGMLSLTAVLLWACCEASVVSRVLDIPPRLTIACLEDKTPVFAALAATTVARM